MINNSIKIHPASEEEIDHQSEKSGGKLSLDIYKTEKEIVIVAPIAGPKKSDIKISINKDILTITGKRKAKEKIKEEQYYTKECFWGDFQRSIILPNEANTEQIDATFENNVLEIKIGRINKEKSKIIKISA